MGVEAAVKPRRPARRRATPRLLGPQLGIADQLTGRFVIGLVAIAVLAITSTVFLNRELARQEDDAGVVKVAAGQAALSYELEQVGLDLALSSGVSVRQDAAATIETVAARLEAAHRGLRFGAADLGLPGDNSARIDEMLSALEGHLAAMLGSARAIGTAADPARQSEELHTWANLFRSGMEGVVFQYEREAENRVRTLEEIHIVLMNAMLLLLVVEGLFLFRPAAKRVGQGWRDRERLHTAEREYDQARLNYLAQFDPLTGLANRSLLWDRLDHAITRARREGQIVALMFVDLDHFKSVNDQFGHAAGDTLLRQVAERIQGAVRESDTVARLGGDEFTVILEGMQRPENAGTVAEKILADVAAPYRIAGREMFMTASIGIVVYPLDGDEVDDLVRDADLAMYAAKDAGRNNYQFFTPELRAQTTQRLYLIDGLRKALDDQDGLQLAYQPKFDLASGEVVGVEALLRWEHPELGMVSPSRFIPLAEETDLIIPLGRWVIETACSQAARWYRSGLDQLRVSVNVSSRQFHYGDLVETVQSALERYDLDPDRLELELTEGALIDDVELARRTLERLRKVGVRVSVDDFGTGYSSLSYLKQFPIDALKIDRSFVDGITDSADDAAISTAIIRMGHSLRLQVVAEGVETEGQLEVLRELGCDIVQGYLLGRPTPPELVEHLVAGGTARV